MALTSCVHSQGDSMTLQAIAPFGGIAPSRARRWGRAAHTPLYQTPFPPQSVLAIAPYWQRKCFPNLLFHYTDVL